MLRTPQRAVLRVHCHRLWLFPKSSTTSCGWRGAWRASWKRVFTYLAQIASYCSQSSFFVQVLLYGNTHRDGTGWHYEWIKPQQIAPHNSDFANIVSEAVTLIGILGDALSSSDLLHPHSQSLCEAQFVQSEGSNAPVHEVNKQSFLGEVYWTCVEHVLQWWSGF